MFADESATASKLSSLAGRPTSCQEVLLHGLESRQDLNGTIGTLVGGANERSRYPVCLDGASSDDGGKQTTVWVKAANLRPGVSPTPFEMRWCEPLGVAIAIHAHSAAPNSASVGVMQCI